MNDVRSLTSQEYDQIRELVYHKFGIHLGEQKQALVAGRLNKILREMGIATFSEYYDYLQSDKSGKGLNTLINRISTNHTFFFREPAHFDFLSNTAIPQLVAQYAGSRDQEFRLWCAGSSSGEEPYTEAMLLHNYFSQNHTNWRYRVLATDISETALKKAIHGVYSAENVEKMPERFVRRFFNKLDGERYEIKDMVKEIVTYRRLNLIRPEFPFRKKFHAIFCRNVMIYFDTDTREALVRRFYDHLLPGGYLFIGHSESISREKKLFNYVQPAIYQKP
ncbi:MAG: protein-glutamate O-methyltransferase CheR [Calditrichaeota bacterium]|nr:protein-glutamate O-methyltransferase CheR [Calditrichota bacterium]